MRLPKTLNVQIGRKLSDKSKDEIMKEVLRVFSAHGVIAVQLMYDTIRVTFKTVEGLDAAKRQDGIHLFGLWCHILGGGPPLTMVHVFDYPFEELDAVVADAFKDFGEVKKVKDQTSIADPEIFTGTRLVSLILKTNPPRSLLIGGYLCRCGTRDNPLCVIYVVSRGISLLLALIKISAAFVANLDILPGSVRMPGIELPVLQTMLLILSLRVDPPLLLGASPGLVLHLSWGMMLTMRNFWMLLKVLQLSSSPPLRIVLQLNSSLLLGILSPHKNFSLVARVFCRGLLPLMLFLRMGLVSLP